MNRLLVAVVFGLLAVGATGCATGVEDPQPPPDQPTQSPAPQQTPFKAELDQPAPPDPNEVSKGLDAPKVDRQFDRPVPVNGLQLQQQN